MKKNKIRMLGRKTITPPTPLMMPSTIRLRSDPSAIKFVTVSLSQLTPLSIHPAGMAPSVKVAWNITHINSRKTGSPQILSVMMRSIRPVRACLSCVSPW